MATTVAVRAFSAESCLVFATEHGVIKKTPLSAFSNPRAGGIIAIVVDEGDRLLAVRISEAGQQVFLATAGGQSIRFAESEVRSMGRNARGVRGIALRGADRVVGMDMLYEVGDILTVSSGGYGKRTALEEYRIQGRGGFGIINLKVSDKTGSVVGVKQAQPDDGMMLVTQEGKIIRISIEGVRVIGRSTQGVKLMDLDPEDRIVAIAKIVERDEDGGGDEGSDVPCVGDPRGQSTAEKEG